jgi:protoheme IX farnesyltransferase
MSVEIRGSAVLPVAHVVPAVSRAAFRDYLALTRPGVVLLAVLTGGPGLLAGPGTRSGILTPLAILLGIVLIGCACSILNAWIERERDSLMARTRNRPLPAGRIRPAEALAFGIAVAAAGLGTLAAWGGALAALIGALTLAWYIAIYTVWAKPRTAHNTVLGAVAGAAPPLIAAAGMDGHVGGFGWALFAIVFAWQPPHVWAITLFRGAEYEAAGFRMMPAVVGAHGARVRMLAWGLALVAVSLIPWRMGTFGPIYAVTALVAGAWFVATIARAIRAGDARGDRRVLGVSIVYLLALFLEMLAELALR